MAAPLLLCLMLFCGLAGAQEDGNLVDTGQLPDSSFIYETSIYDLATSDTYYEGQTVQINGEVVGDIINDEVDPDKRWITVDSLPDAQPASIQVQVSADQAALIDTLGGYQVTGSTVSIMGSFHLACGEHDGLTDLHATSLTVTQEGSVHREEFSAQEFIPAASLVVCGLALYFLYLRKREELR